MVSPGAKTIKKNTNSTQNKSQTHRAKQYEVTSFLSTDCELSTETCSKNVYSLGPRARFNSLLLILIHVSAIDLNQFQFNAIIKKCQYKLKLKYLLVQIEFQFAN